MPADKIQFLASSTQPAVASPPAAQPNDGNYRGTSGPDSIYEPSISLGSDADFLYSENSNSIAKYTNLLHKGMSVYIRDSATSPHNWGAASDFLCLQPSAMFCSSDQWMDIPTFNFQSVNVMFDTTNTP